MKLIGKLISWLLGIVVGLALVFGVFVLVVNAKYKINLFEVIGSLKKLNGNVDVAVIAPKAPTDDDYASAMTSANKAVAGIIVYDDESKEYSLNDSAKTGMTADLKLTDAETCVLVNLMLKNGDAGVKFNAGGKDIDLKDYDFKLVQIALSNVAEKSADVNVVVSIDLTKLKNDMNNFPLNLLKNKVPQKLYVSSTVTVTKGDAPFEYTVASKSLALNNMSGKEVSQLFNVVNLVAKIGTADEFNEKLGKTFIDALIGNESNASGFAYSLKSIGASDFDFDTDGTNNYYVVRYASKGIWKFNIKKGVDTENLSLLFVFFKLFRFFILVVN